MNLAPIVITSPVRRSGTTLLQRLLCSASNTLIYGENSANDLLFTTNLIANKEMLFQSTKAWRNQQLDQVLDGNVDNWIPDLMPEIDGYLAAYQQSALSMMTHYATFAKEQGRTIWGVKLPEWNPANLLQLTQLLPSTKIVYLHRNLADCLRSAKGIQMVVSLQEARQFCHTWKQFSDYALANLTGDQVLHLHYKEFVDDPQTGINTLEQFTGSRDIVRDVMDVKVNTYENDHKLTAGNQAYLVPPELSEEEQALLEEYAFSTAV